MKQEPVLRQVLDKVTAIVRANAEKALSTHRDKGSDFEAGYRACANDILQATEDNWK